MAEINIRNGISVSGISSGAYMASQMHVAYSSTIQAAGIFAAGPYGCAGGSLLSALYECMQSSGRGPNGNSLFQKAIHLDNLKKIDPLVNLQSSKVFLVSGRLDETVEPVIVKENLEFYQSANLPDDAMKTRFDLNLGHAYPTVAFGNECETTSAAPWMSACAQDISAQMMEHFIGPLKFKKNTVKKSFYKVAQAQAPSLGEYAIAYIPKACLQGKACHLHMSLHGCRQNISEVGDAFFRHTGLNELAENNEFIVLYPQAIQAPWLGNPKGCWDWWGYTGQDYALKSGPQMRALKKLIDDFVQNKVQLQKI